MSEVFEQLAALRLITPHCWLEDFARADVREQVRPLVLKQNAAQLLGLAV